MVRTQAGSNTQTGTNDTTTITGKPDGKGGWTTDTLFGNAKDTKVYYGFPNGSSNSPTPVTPSSGSITPDFYEQAYFRQRLTVDPPTAPAVHADSGPDGYSSPFNCQVGNAVRAFVGDANLAGAADWQIYVGVGAVSAAGAVGLYGVYTVGGIQALGVVAGASNGAMSVLVAGGGTPTQYLAAAVLGGTLGYFNPIDAVMSFGGGLLGGAIGQQLSGDPAAGYFIGSVVGGVLTPGVEDFLGNGGLGHAIIRSGISLSGAGAAAGISYANGGDLDSMLFWANVGGAVGGLLSRLWPCFPAGTPVLTPDGWQPIESLAPGDLVLSRDELDVTAPVAPKLIQETFVRKGELYALQFAGSHNGASARLEATPEHPLYVEGRGWTPVEEILPGDRIAVVSLGELGLEALTAGSRPLTRPVSSTTRCSPSGERFTWHLLPDDQSARGPITAPPLGLAEFDLEPDGDSDNHWLTVESNKPTGRFTTVYNFSVADWHTYFVASNDDLDVAIWAHNSYGDLARGTRARKILADNLGGHNYPVSAQAHHIFGVELFDTPLGKKLQKWGIDLNGAENGVYLPSEHYRGRKASLHSGRTAGAYNDEVVERLGEAKNKAEALNILDQIRDDLKNGRLKINGAGS